MQNHKHWLEIASKNLYSAKLLINGESYDDAAYFCQQVAEKSYKAYLTFRRATFKKTHDLIYLLSLCTKLHSDFRCLEGATVDLEPYSTQSRYPDDYIEVLAEDAQQAYMSAHRIHFFIINVVALQMNELQLRLFHE